MRGAIDLPQRLRPSLQRLRIKPTGRCGRRRGRTWSLSRWAGPRGRHSWRRRSRRGGGEIRETKRAIGVGVVRKRRESSRGRRCRRKGGGGARQPEHYEENRVVLGDLAKGFRRSRREGGAGGQEGQSEPSICVPRKALNAISWQEMSNGDSILIHRMGC